MLAAILDLGARREYRDYISAEQAMMATELIMIDLGKADRHRPKLDALYRLVEDEETYRADQFVTGMDQLRAALGLGSTAPPITSTVVPSSVAVAPRRVPGGTTSRVPRGAATSSPSTVNVAAPAITT